MDDARIQTIYAELDKLVIQLDRDPASLGPKHLTDLIALCRGYINTASRITLEIHQEKHHISMELRAQEAAFQIESDELLANDARVKNGPNIEDRKACINILLRDRNRQIIDLRTAVHNLECIEKAVRHRHRELKDTMNEIKLQRSLIRDEIDTQSFYGDETATARGTGPLGLPEASDIDANELERLFNEPSGTPDEPEKVPEPDTPLVVSDAPVPEPVSEPAPAVMSEEDEILAGLGIEFGESTPPEPLPVAPTSSTPTSSDPDDFSSVLEGVEFKPDPQASAEPEEDFQSILEQI